MDLAGPGRGRGTESEDGEDTMRGNQRTRTAAVTESAAQAALRRGPARTLAPDEERVLRMRLGASAPRSAALERLAVASDAEIELMAYEIEAWQRLKATGTLPARAPAAPAPVPVAARPASRTKEKIVRALRRKP
jgi:hypothetical protein